MEHEPPRSVLLYIILPYLILARKLDFRHFWDPFASELSSVCKTCTFSLHRTRFESGWKAAKKYFAHLWGNQRLEELKTGEEALFTDYKLVFCFDVFRSEESSEPNSNRCGIIWWKNSAEIKMLKVIFVTFKIIFLHSGGVFFPFINFFVSCYKVTFKTGLRTDILWVNQSDRLVSQEILFGYLYE